jgi:hypothetical protein
VAGIVPGVPPDACVDPFFPRPEPIMKEDAITTFNRRLRILAMFKGSEPLTAQMIVSFRQACLTTRNLRLNQIPSRR